MRTIIDITGLLVMSVYIYLLNFYLTLMSFYLKREK